MRKERIGILVFVVGMLMVRSVGAQVRAIGLGEAFVGVADDASAVRWNPAGIPLLQRNEYAFSHSSDLFGIGLASSSVAVVAPIGDKHAVGFDFLRRGFDDGELSYKRYMATLSYGYRRGMVSLGVGGKYVYMDTGLDGHSLGKASGFGLDVGALFSPTSRLRLGVKVHDVTGTSVRYDTEVSEEIMPMGVVGGVSFEPLEGWILGVDVAVGAAMMFLV